MQFQIITLTAILAVATALPSTLMDRANCGVGSIGLCDQNGCAGINNPNGNGVCSAGEFG